MTIVSRPSSGSVAPRSISGWLGPVFFLSGFAALVYQLCWQRLLFASFGIDIESVTIIVATFMLGLGIGAFAGGYISDRYPTRLLFVFAAFELGIGLFGAASAPLIRWVGEEIVEASRPLVAVANFLLLIVPTSLMGATLPILTTWVVRREGSVGVSIGRLYFANTLGATAGSLLIAMGIFRHVELSTAIAAAVALNVVAAASGMVLALRVR